MSKAKIARKLTDWFRGAPHRTDHPDVAQCRAELKALLAVARAARRTHREWLRWDEATPETVRAVAVALARLDKVSGGGK